MRTVNLQLVINNKSSPLYRVNPTLSTFLRLYIYLGDGLFLLQRSQTVWQAKCLAEGAVQKLRHQICVFKKLLFDRHILANLF